MGKVSEKYGLRHVRLHRNFIDLSSEEQCQHLFSQLENEKGAIALWGSIPCTVWSTWQNMAIHKYGKAYKERLEKRRTHSRKMLENFIRAAEIVLSKKHGTVSFEWPRHCSGWELPELTAFIQKHNLTEACMDGCAMGLTNNDGVPMLKPWRVVTTHAALAKNLSQLTCKHNKEFKHAPVEGSYTAKTAFYPTLLCETVIHSLAPASSTKLVSSMVCVPVTETTTHRTRLLGTTDGIDVPSLFPEGLVIHEDDNPEVYALVTRLLSRNETLNNPAALRAIRKEADGLESVETWDLSSVQEKDIVVREARSTGKHIHLGQLMSICSEKFAEMPPEFRILKGRIVYRGDIGRDENGIAAVYQDLTASPTTVQGLNHCLAYGSLKGNTVTQADAIKAYVQAHLNAAQPTWIELPKELQPPEWANKYKKPIVLLKKSLYGHPEAGAHWEAHLEKVLKELGAERVQEFCSTFWFPTSRLLLTVYVDDLTLAGPQVEHERFWKQLRRKVDLEPPTDLGRILGRTHERMTVSSHLLRNPPKDKDTKAVVFNMSDYAMQCCQLYESLPGSKRLKPAATPFCSDGALVDADDDIRGQLAPNACKVLMKCLWLGRLARPDIIKPIGDLSTKIQKWTANCDKRLYRLLCYIYATIDHRLVAHIADDTEHLRLSLFSDADFSGEREHTKSTNGGLLALTGPCSFFPIAWISKRQTSTSRSTTEAEVISLAHGVFGEALPALSLWEKLLNGKIHVDCFEDNQATITVVQKGFSPKLRHIARTHRVDLGSLSEVFRKDSLTLQYIGTDDQAADIFTKALPPQKWGAALHMLNIVDFHNHNHKALKEDPACK